MTIRELFEAAAADRALLDKYVIIPHFSDGNAHKHLNEPGHHERFAQLECDCVYIEKPYADLEDLTKDKAYGKIPDWGSRRRAIVATGDNRHHTWERLGAHECWIKLGEETVEGLRQAFLADEARITHATPVVPSEQIVQLSVMSSLTGDELFSINFNDGFNALIGGRGSGKSALLEYLRFGLGRTARDLAGSDTEHSTGFDRDARLIEDTLGEYGYVEVAIAREGVRETWYRDLQDRDEIIITSDDGEETELTIGERTRVLSEAAHKVETEQSRLLKAKFKRDPRPREYAEALIKLLSGARVQDLDSKCQEWVSELSRIDANPSWTSIKRSILELYKAKILAGSPAEPSDEQVANIRKLFFTQTALTRQQSQRTYQNLDDSALSDIFAAVPRDYIVMTYIDQGHDVEFEKASPGQQASALLELLLSQSAGTLIIDQPEDDLDNRIIMEIVAQIRTSKSGRQLLFATHNPNIVVNGDADKVIALKSGDYVPGSRVGARIQVDVDGAIETGDVRDAITHLMEGGKRAFDLRSRKYNFETGIG
jgi:hypothetical protein